MEKKIKEMIKATLNVNIDNMTSRSKKDYAYTILDVTDAISEGCIQKIEAIDGVIRIRVI